MNGFMPGVIAKEIPPGVNDPHITPVGCILHVAVYEGDSLYGIFQKRGGIESHFYVRYDGKIEQYRSIWYEADAQTKGNSFTFNNKLSGFISIETEGLGPGKWTPAQIASIKRIIAFVDGKSPFAKRQAPAWNKPGLGYHSLYNEWNPLHKTCPGADRIKQYKSVILPWWNSYGQPAPETVVGRYKREALAMVNKALDDVSPSRTAQIQIMKDIRAKILTLKNQ